MQLLNPAGRLHTLRSAVDALPSGARRPVLGIMRFSAARLCDVLDAVDALTGRRDPLRPPRRMIGFVGSNSIVGSDYHAIGRDLVALAVRLAGLQPDHAVLEVGSGTGRIAASLTSVLSPIGRFEGFDIGLEGVAWCRSNMTPRFPRFRFQHADIFNASYNPKGRETAATYRFPFADATFDVVMATSVLTHMYRKDTAHYLAEIARVLRPGGRSFLTHFLLTAESRQALTAARSAMPFAFPVPEGLTVDASVPEAAIAIDLDAVRTDYAAADLVMDSILAGRWSGNAEGAHFQDIVVARKPLE